MTFWRVVDPLLLRLRSRLEHLDLHSPSRRFEAELRARARIGSSTHVFPTTEILTLDADQLTIGEYCFVRGEFALLTAEARCSVGHHCYIGLHSRIWVQESVEIGNHVLIAHLVDIHDNNSHSLDWRDRRQDAINLFERKQPVDISKVAAAPVVIEDDVWIGLKSTILKGVRIGRGAVVAAGSVVTRDVPPFTLVAGNPARELKRLE